MVDCAKLTGSVDLVGYVEGRTLRRCSAEEGAAVLRARAAHPDLAPDPELPADTRLWAALQQAGGGVWGGCVYDADAILARLKEGPTRSD